MSNLITTNTITTIRHQPGEDEPRVDFGLVKAKQQAAWSSGDYAAVGSTLQIMGEQLCEAAELRPSWRVLDVATGNGGTAIAAARRGCEVVGIDYVPSLVAQARERAAAERYAITFDEGDAEALPYADSSFDAVLSTLGVMFTADHRRAAAEMLRVCRSRGVLAMANWSPDGFIGRVFRTIGAHVPPAAGVKSPALWGTTAYLEELFGDHISGMRAETRHFMFRYRSPEHFLQFLRINYGPMLKAFEALDEEGRQGLAADLTALMAECNTAVGTLAIPSAYLEVVATRA